VYDRLPAGQAMGFTLAVADPIEQPSVNDAHCVEYAFTSPAAAAAFA
jgi:hypothetical protein